MRTGLLITAVAAASIVTYNEMSNLQRVPRPENYMHIAIVWSILGILAEVGAYDIAVALGTGIVIAMLYTFIINGAPVLSGGKVVTRIPADQRNDDRTVTRIPASERN